jgi:hypothetical protein
MKILAPEQKMQGVMQFDVHPQVVGIQLELVARTQAAVLGDVHGQRGDRAVEGQAPMAVLPRVGPEIHPVESAAHLCLLARLKQEKYCMT